MLLRLAAGIVLLTAFSPCQEGESDVRAAEAERRAKAGAQGEKGERGEKGEIDDERLTPEQRLARNITSGASAYCRLLATVTPAKLLPGQSGTLRILATLQGHAVLPSPAPVEMLGQLQQGPISLGAMATSPASVGQLESGYRGRPVYENYAVFEVPITMAPTAALGGKHPVAVDLKFDLYDGVSAQPIGRFLDRASTEVEVGHVPNPQVKGAAGRPPAGPEAAKPAPGPSSAGGPEAAPPTPPAAPLRGNVVEPAPARPAEPAPEARDVEQPLPAYDDEGGGIPVPLLVGGGVLLLGVLLLIARKK